MLEKIVNIIAQQLGCDPDKITEDSAVAEELGADAVINIRYASSAVMQGAAEVIAYGTAVKFVNK